MGLAVLVGVNLVAVGLVLYCRFTGAYEPIGGILGWTGWTARFAYCVVLVVCLASWARVVAALLSTHRTGAVAGAVSLGGVAAVVSSALLAAASPWDPWDFVRHELAWAAWVVLFASWPASLLVRREPSATAQGRAKGILGASATSLGVAGALYLTGGAWADWNPLRQGLQVGFGVVAPAFFVWVGSMASWGGDTGRGPCLCRGLAVAFSLTPLLFG